MSTAPSELGTKWPSYNRNHLLTFCSQVIRITIGQCIMVPGSLVNFLLLCCQNHLLTMLSCYQNHVLNFCYHAIKFASKFCYCSIRITNLLSSSMWSESTNCPESCWILCWILPWYPNQFAALYYNAAWLICWLSPILLLLTLFCTFRTSRELSTAIL